MKNVPTFEQTPAAVAVYLAPGSRMTLNEALRGLGLTTRPSRLQYQREVMRGPEVVFCGTAHDVTAWLREGCAE